MDEIADCVFRSFDKNQDHVLEMDEFMVGCACLFLSKEDPKKNLGYIFDFYDVNRDGKLSLAELKESYAALYKMLGSENNDTVCQDLAEQTMSKMSSSGNITKGMFVNLL